MYNLADSTWRKQPTFMSETTFDLLVTRVRDHILEHNLENIAFILHGGEPLLLGAKRLDRLFSIFWRYLKGVKVKVNLGIQSNGLLLTEEIGAVLKKHNATIGISIDGVPGVGDTQRVDRKGLPSGLKLELVLRQFLSTEYRTQFTGFIAVPDVTLDPHQTYRYLASFDPPSIDFRLPLNHHESPPRRKVQGNQNTEYGEWYEAIFEEIITSKRQIPVRFLSAIVHGLTGSPSTDLFWGNSEANILVIEADGSYELVDNLKAIGNGLTKTGLCVENNTFGDFIISKNNWILNNKLNTRPQKCESCSLFQACRGCYYISRYSNADGFSKESVYCHDMQYLIPKIHSRLRRDL
jgi:uncharacterized protein